MLRDLVASGHVVDLILGVLALEVLALGLWRRRLAGMVVAALPGLCLLLALRAALVGSAWPWVLVWLALSFPAHLLDLKRRPP